MTVVNKASGFSKALIAIAMAFCICLSLNVAPAHAYISIARGRLDISGTAALGKTLSASVEIPKFDADAPEPLSVCKVTWTINGTTVGTGASCTIPTNVSYVGQSVTCVVQGDGNYYDDSLEAKAGPIAKVDISTGSATVSSSKSGDGTTLTVSFTAFPGASSSDSNTVLNTCSSGWYLASTGEKIGSGTSFSAGKDFEGKKIYWKADASGSNIAIGSKQSASTTIPKVKKPKKSEAEEEEEEEARKSAAQATKDDPEKKNDEQKAADDSEKKDKKSKKEKKEKKETTEVVTPADPTEPEATDPEEESKSSIPWAPIAGGAGLVIVAAIVGAAIRAKLAASAAAAAAAAAGGVGLEAAIAAEAEKLCLIFKHDPRKVIILHDGRPTATKLLELMQEKPFLVAREMSLSEWKTSEEEMRKFNPDLVVLPLEAGHQLSELEPTWTQIKEWCNKTKFGALVQEDKTEAREAQLKAALDSKTMASFAFEGVDLNDAVIRFILPVYKDVIGTNNPMTAIGAVATVMGVPFVATLANLFANGKDLKDTIKAGNIDGDDKISIIGDIAGILGINSVVGVSAFITSVIHAKEDVNEQMKDDQESK